MAAEKCEFCGKFGARRLEVSDPCFDWKIRTYYLCHRCEARQSDAIDKDRREYIAKHGTQPKAWREVRVGIHGIKRVDS